MTAPRSILFFAAGFGTRMRPLTDTRPKPLIEVAGQPLLTHALNQTKGLDLPRKVVNAHYLGDQIAEYAATHGLDLSREEPDILDTGGGLKQALPLMADGPVFTLNTDAVWTGPSPLQTLNAAWDPARMDALLLCVPTDRAEGHGGTGDFTIDAEGRLHRGGPYVYSGAQIIKGACVAARPERAFSLNAVWTDLAQRGRLFGAVHPGGWCDVGHSGGIALAEAMLERAT
ncbi:nucleotidyltransferase family protein [Pseudaestuariivita atlantica]|uniref:Nucleotidyltransferase n=1 Tax=Pseudaestuariivita atlantica TaxID=1317121 RepID=A0A0L1JQG0_9RHOB|nr:nucleotidyltransferase family protein [Pseudaestuariivita atlantica]KNG93658.1 nucleotidyltransferase [Pseudaestuariivita atlantica]